MTISATILTAITLSNLTECVINRTFENLPSHIPKLADRLKKQFSDGKPEVNAHLQKAVLSAHWLATNIFVEQMHKKGLLKDSYNNVNQSIKEELKELKNENYQPVEADHDAYDVANLIKLPEEEVGVKLESDILEFHLKLLDLKTGNVKNLTDYIKLKELIENGWAEENLNWFQLMTAFLNQLLKGDNNKAKDFFQNQTLAEIKLQLGDFENYVKDCKSGIGEERFSKFETALKQEITALNSKLCEIHEDVISTKRTGEETFTKVEKIEADVIEIKNSLGDSRQLNLNVFQQYKSLSSEIDALKIEIEELEKEKAETIEFIETEVNEKKKIRFEKDLANLNKQQLKEVLEREQKERELNEFAVNIEKTWLSVYAENSPRLSEARLALENGDFVKANKILGNDILQHEFEQIWKLDSLLLDKKESLAQEFMVKANLILTQKVDKDWFSIVDKCYTQAITLSESYNIIFTYAYFLQEHSKFTRAEGQYEKALLYASNDYERANTISNLAVLQSYKNELTKAEKSYQEVLKIYRGLAKVAPLVFLSDVADSLNNLGNLRGAMGELVIGEQNYQEALVIYRKLSQVRPRVYLHNVATTLNNLAVLQGNMNEFVLQEKSCKEGLKIRRELALVNPQGYMSDLADSLINFGNVKKEKREFEKAEPKYQEALEIYRKLAKVNPLSYLYYVALTLNNLGNLQNDLGELENAEHCYQEALEIRRELGVVNPRAYLLDVTMTLNNFALFHLYSMKDREKSLNMSLEGFILINPIAVQVPTAMEYCQQSIQIWQAWDEDLLKHLEGLDSARPDSTTT